MTRILLASLLAAAIVAPAMGQSLLDQQLGPTPAGAGNSQTPAADKPADKPPVIAPVMVVPLPVQPPQTTPPAAGNTNDIVSPDAARRVDDADLIEKLIRPDDGARQGNQAAEQLQAMIDRMGQSQKRLAQVDAGEVTQETQRRIIADLDFFIDLARRQQQQGQSQSQGQQQPQDQERQYSQGNQQGNQQNGGTPAGQSFIPPNNQVEPRPGEDIRARGPEEWGNLRPRERDLISHGANEEYLAPYRNMIERYYQGLAELGKNRNK